MYALAISGSPRKGGNTELLLKEVITELKDAGWKADVLLRALKTRLEEPYRKILYND